MRDLNLARVWLFVVPLLACRPGSEEVGDDDVGESGTGDGDGDGESSESGESESGTTTEGETTTDSETDSDTTTDAETDSETTTDSETDSDTTTDSTTDSDTTTGDGDGDNTCVNDSDCALVNDCCNCLATPFDQIPPCDLPECFVPTCEGQFGGFTPEAECRVGTCQLSQIGCDLGQIICLQEPPPPCQGGTIRSVLDNCWGPCVQPNMCETLPIECDASTCGDGYACMTMQSGAPSQCVPLPPDCEGAPSCDCVAPWFDEVCEGSCGESGGTLICEDGG